MSRFFLCSSALLAIAAAADTSPTPTPSISNPAWKFTTIQSIQARVQRDPATFDPIKKEWVLVLPQNTKTFEERYRAAMDTVNTASPEGALMYVQTEGIDKATEVDCMRKTNMSYIWFYDVRIVQPVFSVAEFGKDTGVIPEYGQFVAMDNGMCTHTEGTTLSTACYQFDGLNYQADIGPFVGGEPRVSHPKGNYRDNYWFSFPSSCYTQTFAAKNDKCREKQKGGVCPYGRAPDGITCTFAYKVLGYLKIDDLVGITNTTKENGDFYRDRVEFCKDGKIEYDFKTGKSDLTFWDNPLDEEANAERTQKMLDFYEALLKTPAGKNMKPLPSISSLKNPPCAVNNPRCAEAAFGCRRKLLAQVCEVCQTPDKDCVKATTAFPVLNKQYKPPQPTDENGKPIYNSASRFVWNFMAAVTTLLLHFFAV
jgi:hypothetical protein